MRICLIAGEASADLHGAELVRALREIAPGVQVFGIGGGRLASVGMEVRTDNRDLAVVGISEVLSHAGALWRAYRNITADLARERPDGLVIIDLPDFNLRVARKARAAGIPVVYYIPPQVWAWRRGRVRTIARLVDWVVSILPFEEEIYRQAGVPFTFAGHPLVDAAQERLGKAEARKKLGIAPDAPVLALLPGSRRKEVDFLLPVELDAARRLSAVIPDLVPVIAVAPTVERAVLERGIAAAGVPAHLFETTAMDVLAAADAAVVASGTATLEAALIGTPFVIVYKLSRFTAFIGRSLIGVPDIGLANIVAGRRVVPELLQDEANGEAIARLVRPWLTDEASRAPVEAGLREIRERLGPPGASARAAEAVLSVFRAGGGHAGRGSQVGNA